METKHVLDQKVIGIFESMDRDLSRHPDVPLLDSQQIELVNHLNELSMVRYKKEFDGEEMTYIATGVFHGTLDMLAYNLKHDNPALKEAFIEAVKVRGEKKFEDFDTVVDEIVEGLSEPKEGYLPMRKKLSIESKLTRALTAVPLGVTFTTDEPLEEKAEEIVENVKFLEKDVAVEFDIHEDDIKFTVSMEGIEKSRLTEGHKLIMDDLFKLADRDTHFEITIGSMEDDLEEVKQEFVQLPEVADRLENMYIHEVRRQGLNKYLVVVCLEENRVCRNVLVHTVVDESKEPSTPDEKPELPTEPENPDGDDDVKEPEVPTEPTEPETPDGEDGDGVEEPEVPTEPELPEEPENPDGEDGDVEEPETPEEPVIDPEKQLLKDLRMGEEETIVLMDEETAEGVFTKSVTSRVRDAKVEMEELEENEYLATVTRGDVSVTIIVTATKI